MTKTSSFFHHHDHTEAPEALRAVGSAGVGLRSVVGSGAAHLGLLLAPPASALPPVLYPTRQAGLPSTWRLASSSLRSSASTGSMLFFNTWNSSRLMRRRSRYSTSRSSRCKGSEVGALGPLPAPPTAPAPPPPRAWLAMHAQLILRWFALHCNAR